MAYPIENPHLLCGQWGFSGNNINSFLGFLGQALDKKVKVFIEEAFFDQLEGLLELKLYFTFIIFTKSH